MLTVMLQSAGVQGCACIASQLQDDVRGLRLRGSCLAGCAAAVARRPLAWMFFQLRTSSVEEDPGTWYIRNHFS